MKVEEQYELDARKSLAQLAREWDGCVRCELGQRRANLDTKMVMGVGAHRGIMLVGEGPGETEEAFGQPFVGRSGYLLHEVLKALGIEDLVFITNIVACRSARQMVDGDGNPVFTRPRGRAPAMPRWEDVPPTKPCVEACWPRFHQELYIVDPIVIVAMGGPAVETLLGHRLAVTQHSGKPEAMSVTGVSYRSSLTKKGNWIRSYNPETGFVAPTVQGEVVYTMIPTVHPAHVLRNLNDGAKESPFQQFSDAMRFAARIYERYMLEVHGVMPITKKEETDEER